MKRHDIPRAILRREKIMSTEDDTADLVAAAELMFGTRTDHADDISEPFAPGVAMTGPPAEIPLDGSGQHNASIDGHAGIVDLDSADIANCVTELASKLGDVIIVEPGNCYPFQGAARAGISPDDVRDTALRHSITTHGILEPIILFEHREQVCILAGNRRHAIVTQLRDEGINVTLPARIATFTDIEAVAFAYAQNVGRVEPSAMEQAQSVRWTLDTIEPNQVTVAKAMGMSQAKVSRLLLLASLPEWVVGIVTDPATLSENFAGELQKSIGEPKTAREMEKRAAALVRKNETLPGPAAARYLLTGKLEAEAIDLIDRNGVRHATMQANSRGGLTLRLSPSYRKGSHPVRTAA